MQLLIALCHRAIGALKRSGVGAAQNARIQRINAAGIGDSTSNNMRPIDAIDVWGDGVKSGGEVCFQGEGRLLDVDAEAMPRTKTWLTVVDVDRPRVGSPVAGRELVPGCASGPTRLDQRLLRQQ